MKKRPLILSIEIRFGFRCFGYADFLGFMKKEDKKVSPENSRDTASDKKKIIKGLKIILWVFVVLGVLLGVLWLISEMLEPEIEDISYEDFRFFEADYNKNILEDEVYLSHNRSIYFDLYGSETVLTEDNAESISPSAKLFYDYINCIIDGDYSNYRSFFTSECIDSEGFKLPERFTMQGLYDIHIALHSKSNAAEGSGAICEVYEVSYRIFENNGTFRNDILPDETRTLVFELYITADGVSGINAIGHRANG